MDSTPTDDTKRERRLAARAERQRMADEGRQKAKTRRRVSLGLVVLLALAVLAGGGYLVSQTLLRPSPGRTQPNEGQGHVNAGEPLTFKNRPPSSGVHYPRWSPPGIYTEPIDPGSWVHNLEHGYIVILYNCPSDCPDLVEQLRQFYNSAPKSSKYGYQKIVVTPYKDTDFLITAVAWNHVDELDSFDAERLMAFYKAYLDKGPEDAS